MFYIYQIPQKHLKFYIYSFLDLDNDFANSRTALAVPTLPICGHQNKKSFLHKLKI